MRRITKEAKIAVFALLVGLCASRAAFSQSLGDLRTHANEFSSSLARSLPFNTGLGLNWADAHIGQFLGVPPHFGAGVSMGFTTLNFSAFNGLMDQFGLSLPLNFGGFPLPGYTAEGRIGGFVLPFDVGLKFGILPISAGDFKMDYTLIGGEFRYAVLKGNVALPTVSLGVGVNYLSGGLERSVGQERDFSFPYNSGSATLKLGAPKVGFIWETTTLDFKAQVSKSFLIVTPYLGLGASHAWSKAGYKADAAVSATSGGAALTDAEIKTALSNYGMTDISSSGFSAIQDVTGWGFRTFGGLSVNLAVFRLDLTGMFNFLDANYGVSLGARFQL